MARNIRSGLTLLIAGLLGIAFFVATDVRYGLARYWTDSRVLVDAAHEAWPGTYVGVAGSALIVLIGVWLMTRRTT